MRADQVLGRADGGTRIKVCCIASVEEAQLALDAGADALGLVSAMPSGPGVIPDATIAELAAWIAGRAASVLLTSRLSADGINAQLDAAQPTILQLTDTVPDDELAMVRTRHPDVLLMPVVHVRSRESLTEAQHFARVADAVLLDSGNPGAAVKELGGTGRVHDWEVSRSICESVGVPVFLAGGLTSSNVAQAIATVRPFGVDVCSGVRRDGHLDAARLTAFVREVRAAR